MKKIIAIALSLLCCFSLFACDTENQTASPMVGVSGNPQIVPTNTATGTHIFNVTESSHYLVKNGASDYVVVLPANPTDNEKLAAEELIALFYEATQIRLPIVRDTNFSYSANAKVISVGKTSLVAQAGLTVDYAKLSINGVGIYTKDKNVFLVGGTEYGIVYSAYEFLRQTVGFEQFHTDYYYIDTYVRDVKLMNYDVTDVPDIKRFIANVGYLLDNGTARRRMRASYDKDSLKAAMAGKPADHVTMEYVPYAQYKDHWKWFNVKDNPQQLCFTAHGDAAERELLLEAFAKGVQKAVMDSPGKPLVSVSNMDQNVWCGCPWCLEELGKYGTNAAVYVKFVNEVYDKMMDWFATDEGRPYYTEDFRLVLLAYHKAQNAPAKWNAAKNAYEPIDASVKVRDGVLVEYAPREADYTLPFNHATNSVYYDIMRGWSSCASEMAMWTYSTNFYYHLLPYNTFNSMQYNYSLMASLNSQWIFDQSQYAQYGGATGWQVLKTYLNSKLSWNVNYDIQELIDHFFAFYFGDAATEMRQYFESYRAFSAYQEEELGYSRGNRSTDFDGVQEKYWPKHVIDTWHGNVRAALSAIAPLEERDKAKYEVLYKHIVLERVFLDYILLELYQSYHDAAELMAVKLSFKEAVLMNKMTAISLAMGDGGIAGYLEKLGV